MQWNIHLSEVILFFIWTSSYFLLGRERNRLSPWNPYISPIAKRIFEYFTDSFCELCQKGIGSFDFFISVGVLLRFLFLLVCLFVCLSVCYLVKHNFWGPESNLRTKFLVRNKRGLWIDVPYNSWYCEGALRQCVRDSIKNKLTIDSCHLGKSS